MSVKQKILIVDDDINIAELISLYLTKECFETKIVEDGTEAIRELIAFEPNLILLDLMLPGIDGYEVCRIVRKISSVPIIMLSAKGEVFDKVLGLELGADDYIVKPFDTKELVARVKANLRRCQQVVAEPIRPVDAKIVEYPDLIINQSNYSVLYQGRTVEMPPKELELLYFLASSPNQVFTREQLLDMQESVKQVTIHPDIAAYSVDIVEMTRKMEGVQLGVSPRGNLALLKAAQALAAINGRSYVIPDDIKDLAVPVLGHRIILRGSQRNKSTQIVNLIQDILESVEVPTEDWKNVKQEG